MYGKIKIAYSRGGYGAGASNYYLWEDWGCYKFRSRHKWQIFAEAGRRQNTYIQSYHLQDYVAAILFWHASKARMYLKLPKNLLRVIKTFNHKTFDRNIWIYDGIMFGFQTIDRYNRRLICEVFTVFIMIFSESFAIFRSTILLLLCIEGSPMWRWGAIQLPAANSNRLLTFRSLLNRSITYLNEISFLSILEYNPLVANGNSFIIRFFFRCPRAIEKLNLFKIRTQRVDIDSRLIGFTWWCIRRSQLPFEVNRWY